jgi:hypothetical protein
MSHDPRRRWWGASATLVVLLVGASAPGDEGRETDALVLFDGKSLEGWKRTDFFGAGDVTVEDGTIVMPAGRSMTGITSTRADLPTTNYELRYEAMRLDGNDFFAAATFPVGKSFATFVNGGWGGTVTGLSSLDGADASENETGHFRRFQDKTWYKFRIRVTDKVIRCWIDDDEAVTVDHTGRQVGVRIEVNRNKPLGFATWDTSGAVRGIEIRRLSPAEVAETDKVPEKP